MKQVIWLTILFMVFSTGYAYAQYGDYYDGKNAYYYDDNKKLTSKKKGSRSNSKFKRHEITIGPSLYAPSGRDTFIEQYTGIGGGFDASYQYNFFRAFGLESRFRYNYSNGTKNEGNGLDYVNKKSETTHHLIDIQFLAVAQYDFPALKGTFIPYFGAGFTVTTLELHTKTKYTSVYNDAEGIAQPVAEVSHTQKEVDANVGFIAESGLKYAFSNNVLIGAGVDYTLVYPVHNYSGFRFFLEAGYRF